MTAAPWAISVIIPVHNGGRFLSDAIASIDSQRDPGPFEIIVVDDGSTDDTATVLEAFASRVSVIRQGQQGPGAARNTALRACTTEFVAFCDVDDLWPRDKISVQRSAFASDPTLEVVLGATAFIGAAATTGTRAGCTAAGDDPWATQQPVTNVYVGAGLFRRATFDRVGLFDPSLPFSEDHDWFLRAREGGARIGLVDHVTLLHRIHEQNMTRTMTKESSAIATVLKRSLDRRRRSDGPPRELAPFVRIDGPNGDRS